MSTTSFTAPERILQVAGKLFYREGYRAVGIDRIIAEADVAKATFYKHFPSKDDLIVAWLQSAEDYTNKALPSEDGPEPLFSYVDAMIDIARQPWCLGCAYQTSASEFEEPKHPAHAAAMAMKLRVLTLLETRATKQGMKAAREVAEKEFLLLEGVWASVRMLRERAPLEHAKAAARQLARPAR
jgi:AcrR family transcriptional regulator